MKSMYRICLCLVAALLLALSCESEVREINRKKIQANSRASTAATGTR